MNDDVKLGLRPKPKLFTIRGFYKRYQGNFDNDEAGLGKGIGIFYDFRESIRSFVTESDLISKVTEKPLRQREVVEKYKSLRISLVFGRYICDFYIRLFRVWKKPNADGVNS